MSTYTTYVYLAIAGHESEQEATLHYHYDPACGDDWNEPRTPASVELLQVEVASAKHILGGLPMSTMDILPLLSAKCRQELESWLVGEHEEGMKPDPDYLRDLREVA